MVTITGTYLDSGGQPIRGRGYIEPTTKVLSNQSGDLVTVDGVPFKLDVNGSFSVDVLATDDPTVSPQNFTYRLGFRSSDAEVFDDIIFQAPAAGGTYDVADLIDLGSPLDPSQYDNLAARLADQVAFSYPGTVPAVLGTARIYNDAAVSRTITSVRASAGTAPAGSGLVVDVNLDGASIFTSSPRPQIDDGANTGTAVPDTVVWPSGSYLTVDVAQVGSTTAGADLTVSVSYE